MFPIKYYLVSPVSCEKPLSFSTYIGIFTMRTASLYPSHSSYQIQEWHVDILRLTSQCTMKVISDGSYLMLSFFSTRKHCSMSDSLNVQPIYDTTLAASIGCSESYKCCMFWKKKKKEERCRARKWWELTFWLHVWGEKDVSLQGQGTRTSNCATFGELPSEIVQISGAERRD